MSSFSCHLTAAAKWQTVGFAATLSSRVFSAWEILENWVIMFGILRAENLQQAWLFAVHEACPEGRARWS
jgi:hypothetical protein